MSNPDRSLSFGMQNFMIVAIDEASETYNYYGYLDKKGAILLMRTNKAVTEIRYWIGIGTFATIWAVRTAKNYTTPDLLTNPTL